MGADLRDVKSRIEDIVTDSLADVLVDMVYGDGYSTGFEAYEAAKSIEHVIGMAEDERELQIINRTMIAILGYGIETILDLAESKEE